MSDKSGQALVIVTGEKDLVSTSTSATLEKAATLSAQEFKQQFTNAVSSLGGFSASMPKSSSTR
jgi:predicted nucleic acid-binding protein